MEVMNLSPWEKDPFRTLIEDAVSALDAKALVQRSFSSSDDGLLVNGMEKGPYQRSVLIKDVEDLHVLAVGKAAPRMIQGAFVPLSERITFSPDRCICLSPFNVPKKDRLPDVEYMQGSHPVPGERDVRNMLSIEERLSALDTTDNLIVLLSGGSSSLTFLPDRNVDAGSKSRLISELIRIGADIQELNQVRTFFSRSKGGGLSRMAYPARTTTLTLSDVIGDDPRYIGSGPTYGWRPLKGAVREVLERYGLLDASTEGMLDTVHAEGYDELHSITRNRSDNLLIGNNDLVIDELASLLRRSGYDTSVSRKKYSGEARLIAPGLLSAAREHLCWEGASAYIIGGESTVTVKGMGRGGRNSEMALSLLPLLRPGENVICFSTDGRDGTWSGAGAVIGHCDLSLMDKMTIERYLALNDSGGFFEKFGGGIMTGDTMNNLGDVFILAMTSSPCPPLQNA